MVACCDGSQIPKPNPDRSEAQSAVAAAYYGHELPNAEVGHIPVDRTQSKEPAQVSDQESIGQQPMISSIDPDNPSNMSTALIISVDHDT
ncbi:hypothetical protein ACFX15_007628 [Malus domestica]